MRYIIYSIPLLLTILLISSCKKNEVPYFTDTRYIRFTYGVDGEDPIHKDNYYKKTYSFGYEIESVTEKVIKVPVKFRGYNLQSDLGYSLVVNEGKTTIDKEAYELKLIQPFRAKIGDTDSLEVKFLRKTELLNVIKTLRIELVSNDNFTTHLKDSLFVEFYIDDIFGRPLWWDNTITNAYLGEYSEKKFRAFIEVTDQRDFGNLPSDEKKHYAVIFRNELETTARYEDDGSRMTVTVIGN